VQESFARFYITVLFYFDIHERNSSNQKLEIIVVFFLFRFNLTTYKTIKDANHMINSKLFLFKFRLKNVNIIIIIIIAKTKSIRILFSFQIVIIKEICLSINWATKHLRFQ